MKNKGQSIGNGQSTANGPAKPPSGPDGQPLNPNHWWFL